MAAESSTAGAGASSSAAGAKGSAQYKPVGTQERYADDEGEEGAELDEKEAAEYGLMGNGSSSSRVRARTDKRFRNATYFLSLLVVLLLASNVYTSLAYWYYVVPEGEDGETGTSWACRDAKRGSRPPQYFQTSPQLWAGPTATGKPAFLAQTRTFEPSATFVPNQPLQTDIPVSGMQAGNQSIFHNMGYLSPYQPSPGFGVDEYPLPPGADIVQVQMLSRHGSRYPTGGSNVADLGQNISWAKGNDTFHPKGDLAFLRDWEYQMGAEILVPKGRQELFDSGVLHSYMYGKLYNPNSKIIVRTTVCL